MSEEYLEGTSNPLALIRSLPTRLIPIEQIKVPEGLPPDDVFLAKYSAFLRGRVPIHETRLELAKIRRGFWKWTTQGWILQGDLADEENVSAAIQMVRFGSRPVLHLYDNPNKEDPTRFVCTDDTVVHAAYERLGIAKAPVAIMAKPRDLEESCISIRNYSRGKRASIALIDGFVPVTSSLVPSVLGSDKPPQGECFERLLAALRSTRQMVKAFHVPGSTTLHYHHTLYSVLFRAEDCIESMGMLVQRGKPLTAAGLLRSLHELTLVFYVDWLAPGQTYRYLQLASVMSESKWIAECEEGVREDIAAGASPIEAKNIRDAQMRGYRLGSVVGDRARLFPLGDSFQRDIYSFLSDVIHHDFSMTARYAFTLDHGDEAVYDQDATQTVIHVSDILVGAIVSRIRDDIGDPRIALRDSEG
jgi:hypothetical protein